MKKKFYIDTEFHEYEKVIEFDNYQDLTIPTIDLISIGIVYTNDGMYNDDDTYYAVSNEFDIDSAWNNVWLRDNVLKSLFPSEVSGNKTTRDSMTLSQFKEHISNYGKSRYQIAEEIKVYCSGGDYNDVKKRIDLGLEMEESIFTGDIEFYAYYADYDWVVFCWLFGRMIDLPKGFPMYCKDLKQVLDEKAEMLAQKISNTQPLGLSFDNLKFIKSLSNYPTQKNEHNALDDAKWNKKLHDFLNRIK